MTAFSDQHNHRRYHQRAGDERLTPPWLLQRVKAFLGDDWFDPCPATGGATPTVNGLTISWRGRVYCNPPYSHMPPWARKFLSEPFREGLFLCSAYTETSWFQPLLAENAVLFFSGRLYFVRGDTTSDKPHPFGSALVYRGYRPRKFVAAFGDLGSVVWPSPRRSHWIEEVSA